MLTDKQKKNVLFASAHPLVQKRVVEGMFDCMSRGDTGVSDIWEYVEDESYPDPIRSALFGNSSDEEDGEDYEEDEDAVANSIEAQQLLIDNVRQIVLDSFTPGA